jgi:hypothetical protein
MRFMQVERTNRGFELIRFTDHGGHGCSLQQSSAIGDNSEPGSSFVWLGVEGLVGGGGRMHLSEAAVRELVGYLGRWLEAGTFE